MRRHAPATTYNLTDASDQARWERVHCYQPGELLSAVLWREFAEVERAWHLDPAVLEAYRRDLQRHVESMAALELSIGNQVATGDDPTWLLHRQSAAVVLERAQLAPRLAAGCAWAKGQSKGGRQRAKHVREDCADRDRRMIAVAQTALRNGRDKRELVGIICGGFSYLGKGVSKSTARRVLRKHGLIE